MVSGATILPSTLASSQITRCEAWMSPTTRPATCSEPAQMMLPVISMPGPSVETLSAAGRLDAASMSLGSAAVVLTIFMSRSPFDGEK